MELTVKELFHDAVLYDVPNMAHAVYYAVQKGLVQWDDPESRIPYEQLDYGAIGRMRNENWLEMCTVKLFVVPLGGRRFAIYFAEREEEARMQHRRIYGMPARWVGDVSSKMDSSVYCEESRLWQSFWELKRQTLEFPCFVGEF
ncbi:hypothetical protein M3152_14565 [Sporosarcina luteola]|uniref:hypothetical protein n=1 Tax=Sporosarcina luteola TaxID=582850 RepID=UPI002040D184|nr:hypothetical protein [Sporosarcina luteola]MCM3638923.1 hypothetical protein [Sporosarcina luteola]